MPSSGGSPPPQGIFPTPGTEPGSPESPADYHLSHQGRWAVLIFYLRASSLSGATFPVKSLNVRSCFLSFLNFPMTLLFIVSPTHPTAGTPFFLHLSTDPMSLTAPGGPLPWSETRLAEPLPGRSVLPLGEALVKGAQQGAARDCGCQPPPCGWAGRSGLLRARSCQALTCQSHLEASPGLPFCCTENTQDSESSLSRSEF